MKIGIVGTDIFAPGKANLLDERIKVLKGLFNSPKEVYIQVDIIVDEDKIVEADGIIAPESAKLDLVVHDMEFVETRLGRTTDDAEKVLLNRFKDQLDRENFISGVSASEEEQKLVASYSLWTNKPVFLAKAEDLQDKNKLLLAAYAQLGYISFFTAGDKDAHGWSIKRGATAWDAAGAIHSDIQKGFIRAEAVNFKELVADGGLSKARSSNHVRLEMKEYIVQDGDYLVIRTNK